jgi:hypothetical protein
MLVAQCGGRGKIFNRRERQGSGEREEVQPGSLPATILPGWPYNIVALLSNDLDQSHTLSQNARRSGAPRS